MLSASVWGPPRRFTVFVVAVALAAGLASVPTAHAADADAALKLIPADASFYCSMLRNREQLDAVLKSKAYARLLDLPALKMAHEELAKQMKQPNPAMQMALGIMHQPENQQLLTLLGDMVSDEVFLYGGENFTDFLQLLQAVGQGMQFSGFANAGAPPDKALPANILKILAANKELIRIPDFIIGFKVRDSKPADAQLKRLEDLTKMAEALIPFLNGRFKRAKVGSGDFVTLSLDGSLVPWEGIIKNFESEPGQLDDLVKKLKTLKFSFSIGIRDNFVLIAFGESTAALAKLGGAASLGDRPEFKPMAAYQDKRMVSVGYVSEVFRRKIGTSAKDFDNLVNMADAGLQKANLPADKVEKVKKDIQEIANDLKRFVPKLGAAMSFSFLTERGQEGYSYDWSEYPTLDATKPLTMLNHVGGSPLFAWVKRGKYSPENYEMVVKWLKMAHADFEEIVLPMLDDEKKGGYEQVSKIAIPLLKRLEQVTSTMFNPSLAEGQFGFVLDAKMKSSQWFTQGPATEQPMPMLEPAVVFGVSDAALLRKAMGEYRNIVNDFMTKLHELNQDIPAFQIPEPETKTVKGGSLYFYPIPQLAAFVDPQISPNAALSDKVAALTISHTQSERLLSRMPLKVSGGPLADLKKPMSSAVYFDFAGTIDALSPWIDFGVKMAVKKHGEGDQADPKKLEDILAQVRTGLEILKVFKGATSCTYLEDKVYVTHSEMVIKDLD